MTENLHIDLEIRRLLASYADAVCRRDSKQWSDTWAEDAQWDMGFRVMSGRDDIVASWIEMMSNFDGVVHYTLGGSWDLQTPGSICIGRWYVAEHFRPSGGTAMMMYGYYDDSYVLELGSWKFARRALTGLYQGPPDLSGSFTGFIP